MARIRVCEKCYRESTPLGLKMVGTLPPDSDEPCAICTLERAEYECSVPDGQVTT